MFLETASWRTQHGDKRPLDQFVKAEPDQRAENSKNNRPHRARQGRDERRPRGATNIGVDPPPNRDGVQQRSCLGQSIVGGLVWVRSPDWASASRTSARPKSAPLRAIYCAAKGAICAAIKAKAAMHMPANSRSSLSINQVNANPSIPVKYSVIGSRFNSHIRIPLCEG